MVDRGMDHLTQEQNSPGGELVEEHEIVIGPATYVVQRVFQGKNTIRDLLISRLEREKMDDSPFDEQGPGEV